MLVFTVAVSSALVFSFFCSISEAALLSIKHSQIEALGKSRAGRLLSGFKKEIDVPIAAILILNTVANTTGASVAGAAFVDVWDESKLWIFTATFTLSVLIFAEIVPKTLGVVFAGRLAVPVAYGVRFLIFIFRPLLAVTRTISSRLRTHSDAPVTSLDEIALLASLGRSEGVLRQNTASIIEGAVALRELRARDVMVPRGAMAIISGERELEDNLRTIRQTGHSRFPFSPTGEPDDISGVVLTKDLLFQLHETPDLKGWDRLVTKAFVVPASMQLERLLQTFREKRRHLAIVVDEYGGTQGLVTLEDVLEEIVGEIEDENDRVNLAIVRRSDGSLLCRGWAEVRKVFEALGVEDEETDAVSVGGIVSDRVGRVPRSGDIVKYAGLEWHVIDASARRAETIEVRPLPPDSKDSDAPPSSHHD